jgi:hypothetical protein
VKPPETIYATVTPHGRVLLHDDEDAAVMCARFFTEFSRIESPSPTVAWVGEVTWKVRT